MKLADLRGRLTLVLTPELRQFALDEVRRTLAEGDEERDTLIEWFQEQETPDGTVLDAAYSEAECTMIHVVLRATLNLYEGFAASDPNLDNSDLEAEEAVRTISRY